MQAFLTFAAEFVALSGFAMLSIAFVSGYGCRAERKEVLPDVLIDGFELAAEMARISAEVAAERAIAPQPSPVADVVVPFVRPVRKVDLSDLTIRQLKAIAKAAKLPKYSNNTSPELMERLAVLPNIAALVKVAA